MPVLYETAKRLLVGRPMQSERLGHTLLPKRIALPVFASDALSSVAYATQEILLVLAVRTHYTIDVLGGIFVAYAIHRVSLDVAGRLRGTRGQDLA